jgi:hypothetical protein
VLLPDFISHKYLASSISELDVDEGTGNGRKQKHVHKDEDDKIDVIGLIILYGKSLIVRI